MGRKKIIRIKNCEYCNIEFDMYRKLNRKFCSISCSTKRQFKEKINFGLQKEHKLRNGKKPWNKGISNLELSERQKKNNVSKRPEVKEKMRNAKLIFYAQGNKPWNWNGGNSKNRKYTKKLWIEFAKKIYLRDNYACQDCEKKGGKLNAHHIKEWSNYPELAFDEKNIITLCISCHSIRHKSGIGKRFAPQEVTL